MLHLSPRRAAVALSAVAAVALAVACSDETGTSVAPGYTSDAGTTPSPQPTSDAAVDTGAGPVCTTSGGQVSGAASTRCVAADGGKTKQEVSEASCHPDGGAADHAPDAADAANDDPASDYGDTLYGTEGDDDDCKYHVKWSATNVCTGADATFKVGIVTTETGAAPLPTGIRVEAYLDETHPAPNTNVTAKEDATGTGIYTVGPVKFDKPGRWTVRFHFREECSDALESSPHGHAAFFVDVP